MTNSRGDVVALFDSTGKELARYGYDAWGNCRVTTPTGAALTSATHIANINPLRYRGYYLDTDSGLYYLQSLYYDSITHRFLNADGIIGANGDMLAYNLFTYCSNNPVNAVDPTGKAIEWIIIGGMGLLFAWLATMSAIASIPKPTYNRDPLYVPYPNYYPSIPNRPKAQDRPQEKAKDVPRQMPRDPVHHIVAKADHRAAESRKILRDVGIEPVIAPINLVVLPQSYHTSMHTTGYHNYVTERLRPVAGDKVGIEITLNSLRAEIQMRSALGIRWD